MSKDRLSFSQISSFHECQRSWWIHYILGVESPSTIYMRAGTCVHAALEEFFNHKIETGKNLSVDAVVSKFVSEFEKTEEMAPVSLNEIGKMEAKVVPVLMDYYNSKAVNMIPAATEQSITAQVTDTLDFKGVVDLQLVDGTVIDFKLTGDLRRINEDFARESKQSAAYAMLLGKPINFQYHVLYRNLKFNPVRVYTVSADQEKIDNYKEYVIQTHVMMDEIIAGIKKPTCKGIENCSEFTCSHMKECAAFDKE